MTERLSAESASQGAADVVQYVPELCVWELTLKCNMRCIHCGSAAGQPRQNELTVDECLAVADELVDLGCRQVTFIGGEVFLYKGWEIVARRLSDREVTVNMVTNGYFLGEDQIAQIRHARLTNVGVSLDGLAENHNFIRRNSTSFQKVLESFERLRNASIPIAVVTSLLNLNVSGLESMYELLVRHGVSVWQIQVANAMGNMAARSQYLLDPAWMPRITEFIRRKRFEGDIRVYAADDIGYYDEHEMYLRNSPGTISVWRGCQAGLKVVGIDSVGNVKGCESLYSDQFVEGNLRAQSLQEIWCKEDGFAYNRQFDVSKLAGRCRDCDKGAVCRGGCRGSSYFSTGSLYENAYCCYPVTTKS